MKTNYKHYLSSALAATALLSTCFAAPTFAKEWKASIAPASLNNDDKTVRLVSEAGNVLVFYLQADQEVLDSAKEHDITVEFDLPGGASILGSGGYYNFTNPQTTTKDGRIITAFEAKVPNNRMIGKIGARLVSEWQNQSVFVSAPKEIPAGQKYLRVTIKDGNYTKTEEWPLQVNDFAPPSVRPKRTTIGIWDYNFSKVNNEATSKGIAQLFTKAGVTFTQAAGDETYRKVLQDAGILTGGNTHHSLFFSGKYPDYDAKGNKGNGFADPTSIINLPADAEIPGVKSMVKIAQEGDGIATFDYEPTAASGYSPTAIAAFKKKYNVSDADFEKFQANVAKDGLMTFASTDPVISKIWKQWTQFRTDQTSNYVRRIYQAFKKEYPQGRMAVTPSWSYGNDTLKTHALGTNDAAMAQYTDIIMPQIYSGYGAANAKLAMRVTAGWKQEIIDQKAKTQLWPLLLVRYSGASVYNSPQRLRQQMIGSLANGANGILFYYPGLMDASYWEMVARTAEDIAQYEDFYQDGKRVDEQFKLSDLPLGTTEVSVYPGYKETVENPSWSFTAHQLGSKVLLTLINLEESNDLVFGIDVGKAKFVSSKNVEPLKGPISTIQEEQNVSISGENQWLVAPGQIGFIVLERE